MQAVDRRCGAAVGISPDFGSGDNRRHELQERKVVFLTEISRWVEDRRHSERLTREQLGALGGIERLQAQRQSLLDNMAHYFRAHPTADAALGVLALATVFSDNNDGCCTLSVERMAKFLSRTPRRITAAIAALAEARTIVVERVDGGSNRIYPWVHSAFGSTKDPVTWIMDVRAPRATAGRPGRPAIRNTPDAGVTPISEIPLTLVTNTPDAGDQIPLTLASPYTTNIDTTHEREARARTPRFASQRESEVTLSDGVRHLTNACQAQRFGDRPTGHDLAQWQRLLEASRDCQQISASDADDLAGTIVSAGERFWPAASKVRAAIEERSQGMAQRAAYNERYRQWLPIHKAYVADREKADEIESSIPRVDYRQRAQADDRWRRINDLMAAAGVDLDRHPEEARETLTRPETGAIKFRWSMPERRKAGGSYS